MLARHPWYGQRKRKSEMNRVAGHAARIAVNVMLAGTSSYDDRAPCL